MNLKILNFHVSLNPDELQKKPFLLKADDGLLGMYV